MASKSSDSTSGNRSAAVPARGERAVYVVSSDPTFLDRVYRECEDAPPGAARFAACASTFRSW